MPKPSLPSQLITAAAKATLPHVGCVQLGRSRTWISDERYWAIVVEFKPSGFSKGSGLNVAACWHWPAKNFWTFDYGGPIAGHIRYQDEQQFAPAARQLAMRAGAEVTRLRDRFKSMRDIARALSPTANARGWRLYHAAVAAGFCGEVDAAGATFERLLAEPATRDWEKQLHIDVVELLRILPDTNRFREAVRGIVHESRALHGLPPDSGCLEPA